MPSAAFPSDHAIVAADLRPARRPGPDPPPRPSRSDVRGHAAQELEAAAAAVAVAAAAERGPHWPRASPNFVLSLPPTPGRPSCSAVSFSGVGGGRRPPADAGRRLPRLPARCPAAVSLGLRAPCCRCSRAPVGPCRPLSRPATAARLSGLWVEAPPVPCRRAGPTAVVVGADVAAAADMAAVAVLFAAGDEAEATAAGTGGGGRRRRDRRLLGVVRG